jgi:hypothetical protein
MFTDQIVEMVGLNSRTDVKLRMDKATGGINDFTDEISDGFSFMIGPPSTLIVSLGTTHDYRLSDCKSIVMPYLIVLREDLPKGVVYEIVKTFFEHNDECVANYASIARTGVKELELVKGEPSSFHPEALQYYRERGWMK